MNKETINFKNSKGQNLVGDLYIPDTDDYPIVIFIHGFTSDRKNSKSKRLSSILPEKGIGFFSIDLSGRGDSDGEFEDTTLTQYIDDVKCAIDTISEYSDKIGIIGSSLGGIISLQEKSKDSKVKALVLVSPVSVFPHKSRRREFSPEGLKEWKEKGYALVESGRFGDLKLNYGYYEDAIQYGDYSVYDNIDIPVLIIHGTADESVLMKETEELTRHLKNYRLIRLEGADHRYTNPEHFDKMIDETVKFFEEVLK